MANYTQTTQKGLVDLRKARSCLIIAQSGTLTARLADVAEASIVLSHDAPNRQETTQAWELILARCRQLNYSPPIVRAELADDELQSFRENCQSDLDRIRSELASFAESRQADTSQRIERYTTLIRESEIVTRQTVETTETTK
jgi:hypothetical protein